MPSSGKGSEGNGTRPRGRPRRDINLDAVADAVAELFAEGGQDAVSVAEAAEKLSVSRATLYRTVPTKDDLLGILFERSTRELTKRAQALVKESASPRDQLRELIRLQVDAAIRMRRYLPVFFGGGDLPSDVVSRWHRWSRKFEALWVGVVTEAMRAGELEEADPVITTRLLLGMCIWVSRWYRPDGPYDAEEIMEAAIRLVHVGPPSPGEPQREPTAAPATAELTRKQRRSGTRARAGRAAS